MNADGDLGRPSDADGDGSNDDGVCNVPVDGVAPMALSGEGSDDGE